MNINRLALCSWLALSAFAGGCGARADDQANEFESTSASAPDAGECAHVALFCTWEGRDRTEGDVECWPRPSGPKPFICCGMVSVCAGVR